MIKKSVVATAVASLMLMLGLMMPVAAQASTSVNMTLVCQQNYKL